MKTSEYALSLKELKEEFAVFLDEPSQTDVERFTQAFIMDLFGSIMFVDNTKDTVLLMYLQFLRDLQNSRRYIWGAAMLAYLYRHLCFATTPSNKSFSGPIILCRCGHGHSYLLMSGMPSVFHFGMYVEGIQNPIPVNPDDYRRGGYIHAGPTQIQMALHSIKVVAHGIVMLTKRGWKNIGKSKLEDNAGNVEDAGFDWRLHAMLSDAGLNTNWREIHRMTAHHLE